MTRRSTSRRTRSALVLVAAVCATASVLTACGAGQTPLTSKEKSATQGLNLTQGSVKVLNAAVVLDQPVPAGATSAPAHLRAVILNTGPMPDTLMSVTSPAAAKVAIGDGTHVVSSLALPTNKPQSFGNGTVTATFTDVSPAPIAGSYVTVVFTFALAGELSVSLPVLDAASE